jgi:ADP-ribose pyrophosphatase YjhB (NUDIX family)
LSAKKQNVRKALFFEGNVPPGGVCLSSFVVVDSGDALLVGKMAKPEIWVERFFVGERWAKGYVESGKYVLPASHLAWYESPLDAAIRILNEQVLMSVKKERVKLFDTQSQVSVDISGKGEPPHWDLCFVYRVEVSPTEAHDFGRPEWFEDLGFKPKSSLKPENFARGHGDVLQEAGVLR